MIRLLGETLIKDEKYSKKFSTKQLDNEQEWKKHSGPFHSSYLLSLSEKYVHV